VSSPEAIEKFADRNRTHPMTTSMKVVNFRRATGYKFNIASPYRVATSNNP
jgi:hypothetical protein